MYSASKWLKHPVLLDLDELKAVLAIDFSIHNVSDVVQHDEISKERFLSDYQTYIEGLKEGEIRNFRRTFSSVFTTSKELLDKKEVKPGHFIVKPTRPVVQLQAHHFLASNVDGKIHPMVVSQDSVSWGLQFSYPQLFQDPVTKQIIKVDHSFSNTTLFHQLVRYFRQATVPTTFVHRGEKVSTSIRIGKKCFEWIHSHPQLKEKGIEVYVY